MMPIYFPPDFSVAIFKGKPKPNKYGGFDKELAIFVGKGDDLDRWTYTGPKTRITMRIRKCGIHPLQFYGTISKHGIVLDFVEPNDGLVTTKDSSHSWNKKYKRKSMIADDWEFNVSSPKETEQITQKFISGVKPVDLKKAYPSTVRFYKVGISRSHGYDEITENYAQFSMKVMCIEGGRYRRGYVQRTPKKECIYTVNLKEWDSDAENISVVEIPDRVFPKSLFKPAFFDENGWEVA